MKKIASKPSVFFIPVILIALLLLSACGGDDPRLAAVYTFNPGAPFTTNINDEDHRRTVRCAVIFKVIDEAASEELNGRAFVIRDTIIAVLGDLTLEELTVNKDLHAISERLVTEVNIAVNAEIDLIVGAYFTEFTLT